MIQNSGDFISIHCDNPEVWIITGSIDQVMFEIGKPMLKGLFHISKMILERIDESSINGLCFSEWIVPADDDAWRDGRYYWRANQVNPHVVKRADWFPALISNCLDTCLVMMFRTCDWGNPYM